MADERNVKRRPGIAKALANKSTAARKSAPPAQAPVVPAAPTVQPPNALPPMGQSSTVQSSTVQQNVSSAPKVRRPASLPKLNPEKIEKKLAQEQQQDAAKVSAQQKKRTKKKSSKNQAPIVQDFKKVGGAVKNRLSRSQKKKIVAENQNSQTFKSRLSSNKTVAIVKKQTQRIAGNDTIALINEKTIARVPKPFKIATAIIVPMFLVYMVVSLLVNSSAMAITTIQVQGNKAVSTQQLQDQLKSLIGKPLAKVGKNDVVKLAASMSQIEDFSVQSKPPHTLIVSVTERQEAAVIEDNGKFVIIDPTGVEIKTVDKRTDANVPLLDGGRAALNQGTFTMLSTVMKSLPPEITTQLDKIAAASPTSVVLTLKSGAKIFWGDGSQSDFKARVVKLLIDKNQSSGIQEYDVSTPERPVTKGGTPAADMVNPQPTDMPFSSE